MLIKTNKRFDFIDSPQLFIKKDIMISATRLASDERSFLIGLRHRPTHSKEAKIRMDKGKEEHEKRQIGLKTLKEYDYINFRKDLCTNHLRISLKEVEIISPNNAIYGIIDHLIIEFTKEGDLKIWVTEYKGSFSLGYLFQLFAYTIALSDTDCRCVLGIPYKRRVKHNRKEKREIGYLFPSPNEIKTINIFGRLFNYNSNKEQIYESIISNSQVSGEKQGIYLATLKRLHTYQSYMIQRVIDLSDFNHDEKGYCCANFPHICPKIKYNPLVKQTYFSKAKNPRNIIIKSKPPISI